MTAQVAMTLWIGAAFDWTFEIVDEPGAGESEGAPIDITGWSLKLALADDDGARVLEASTDDGRIVITDAVNGAGRFAIPPEASADIAAGIYTVSFAPVVSGQLKPPLFWGQCQVRSPVVAP